MRSVLSSRLFVLAAVAATLVGCGGGGSDSPSEDLQQVVQPAGPIDSYLGTIIGDCHLTYEITDATTNAEQYLRISLTLDTKVSGTMAQGSYRYEVFGNDACTGSPRHAMTTSGPSNFLRIDGSVVIDDKVASKVTFGAGAVFPGLSAASIVVNGLRFTGERYMRQDAHENKDLIWLSGEHVHFGDGLPDADGYPTALEAEASGTLQRAL